MNSCQQVLTPGIIAQNRRMTAINNDDRQTARMVESLASQLRYLIGNSNDTVTVGDELKSIEDYF